jgi:hypothetical protein
MFKNIVKQLFFSVPFIRWKILKCIAILWGHICLYFKIIFSSVPFHQSRNAVGLTNISQKLEESFLLNFYCLVTGPWDHTVQLSA